MEYVSDEKLAIGTKNLPYSKLVHATKSYLKSLSFGGAELIHLRW